VTLLVIFGLVMVLAIVGMVLSAVLGTDDGAIRLAMQIIGYGGPSGTAVNNAVDRLGGRRQP
jgi:hypothetical protein